MVGVVRLMYIPKALIVHGDAAATANNIATLPGHEGEIFSICQPFALGEVRSCCGS